MTSEHRNFWLQNSVLVKREVLIVLRCSGAVLMWSAVLKKGTFDDQFSRIIDFSSRVGRDTSVNTAVSSGYFLEYKVAKEIGASFFHLRNYIYGDLFVSEINFIFLNITHKLQGGKSAGVVATLKRSLGTSYKKK